MGLHGQAGRELLGCRVRGDSGDQLNDVDDGVSPDMVLRETVVHKKNAALGHAF